MRTEGGQGLSAGAHTALVDALFFCWAHVHYPASTFRLPCGRTLPAKGSRSIWFANDAMLANHLACRLYFVVTSRVRRNRWNMMRPGGGGQREPARGQGRSFRRAVLEARGPQERECGGTRQEGQTSRPGATADPPVFRAFLRCSGDAALGVGAREGKSRPFGQRSSAAQQDPSGDS